MSNLNFNHGVHTPNSSASVNCIVKVRKLSFSVLSLWSIENSFGLKEDNEDHFKHLLLVCFGGLFVCFFNLSSLSCNPFLKVLFLLVGELLLFMNFFLSHLRIICQKSTHYSGGYSYMFSILLVSHYLFICIFLWLRCRIVCKHLWKVSAAEMLWKFEYFRSAVTWVSYIFRSK